MFDRALERLDGERIRLRQIDAQRRELDAQKQELEKKLSDLDWQRYREGQDVERLEGRSLARFFYRMTGRLEEKLNKEREEALAAAVKYDAAKKELLAVESQIDQLGREALALRGCEERYQEAFAQKTEALRDAGGEAARQLEKLDRDAASLALKLREIDEALTVGRRANELTEEILDHLDSAEGFGTWDMLGGGMIADLAKHGHLDDAQARIEALQIQLRQFSTELADVRVDADIQASIDGFLHFADYFFDGLFADWAVMDQIGRAKEQASRTKAQIARVLSRLEGVRAHAQSDRLAALNEMERLVRNTPL